jgi:uncharacterized protein DUF6504
VPRFVSEPIEPESGSIDPIASSRGEPPLPTAFRWRVDRLVITEVLRAWRSTKEDRGDAYLDRHWFEVKTLDGRTAIVYFLRRARRGSKRWWLYSIAP